jgi:hypothetical protein
MALMKLIANPEELRKLSMQFIESENTIKTKTPFFGEHSLDE